MESEAQRLIDEIGAHGYKDGSSLTKGTTYHPIPFPEFKDVPYHKSNCVGELQIVNSLLGFSKKHILEIGSNVGYFTFNLARMHKSVVGYEGDISNFNLAAYLRGRYKISNVVFNPTYIKEENIKRFIGYDHTFDSCLFINTHQWVVKQIGFERSKNFMKLLSQVCNQLIFQTAHRESSAMNTVKELENCEAILSYLEECGWKSQGVVFANLHDGKPRYMMEAISTWKK